MNLKIYAVKDVQADAFMQPIIRPNEEVSVRDFTHAVTAADSPMSANADDYILYEIGDWDDESGYVIPCDPRIVITGTFAVKESRIISRENKTIREKLDALHAEIEKLKEGYDDAHANFESFASDTKTDIVDIRRKLNGANNAQ